jgi:hypothetical protein
MSEYIGHFSLWGDFAIEEITERLGIQPSQIFPKGEMLEGASAPSKVSTWDLHCPPNCQGMQEQIKSLLDILWPKAEVLKPLAAKFHADLNISSSCEDGTSILSLDHEVLQKLVALNLNLNCFYNCGEDSNAN